MTSRVALGRRAEAAVADYLRARSFAVIGQNVRVGALEIDIVARRGPLVVLCEVRSRGPGSLEGALASVSRTKRTRMLRAADRLWRARLAKDASVERVRIDVAAVRFEGERTFVEYFEGAVVADPPIDRD